MVFSKVQILQALQAKIENQQNALTNPPSATSPSQHEDDGIDSELDSDSDLDSNSAMYSVMIQLIQGGISSFLSMELAATASLTGLLGHFQKFTIYHILKMKSILRGNKIIKMQFSDSKPEQITHEVPCWKAKESPVRFLKRIRKIDTGMIYKFTDDILNWFILGLVCQAGKDIELRRPSSCQDSLIDNSAVMANQIVPQEGSPLITIVRHSRTNYSYKSSKTISSCSGYSLDLDPSTRPSNASGEMIGDVGISSFHRNHYSDPQTFAPIHSLCFHGKFTNIDQMFPGDVNYTKRESTMPEQVFSPHVCWGVGLVCFNADLLLGHIKKLLQLMGNELPATNTRAVSLKEETKEPNQGGGSTGFRDPANKQGKRAG
eukprot:jgi/Psemu1/19355/gm1.19355_g